MKAGDDYRRRYWPLVLWILLLIAGMGLLACCPEALLPPAQLSRLMLAFTMLSLDLLMFMVWRLEAVYWISGGPDFETAKDAGSTRRKRYAWLHLKRFLIVTAPVLLLMALSAVLSWPEWLDILLFCAALLVAAISTIKIQF